MSGTTEMNFLFPVRDKGAWVRDCASDERKFQFGKQEGEKKPPLFIFYLLPLFNDDTGRPPHTGTGPPTHEHYGHHVPHNTHAHARTHEYKAFYAQGRDMTRVTHSSFSCRDKWERLLHGKAQQQLCMGSFVFCCVCVICFPFMYTGQLQPAEPLLLQYYVYYVHYVHGLAAPLNLSRLSEGAEFGFTICVLVMMSEVSK